MALTASLNIDAQTPIARHEDLDRVGRRIVPSLMVDGLLITFSSWQGTEAVCRNLDRLIVALTELRAHAGNRLVDEVVADLEAHPIVVRAS